MARTCCAALGPAWLAPPLTEETPTPALVRPPFGQRNDVMTLSSGAKIVWPELEGRAAEP